jgi:hypothetical protein
MLIEIEIRRQLGLEIFPHDRIQPVRPIWKVVTLKIPDGEIDAEAWDIMSRAERKAFMGETGKVER